MSLFYSATLLAVTCALALPYRALGHDIPKDATVQAFVKPAGQRLNLLVRVPLKAIRDVDFPEQAGGYLDLVKLAPLLPDAATIWIAGLIEIYEGDIRLPKPRIVAANTKAKR